MKRLAVAFVTLLLLVGVAGFVLLATAPGLRFVVGLVAPLVPGELSVQSISGKLIGPLEVAGLDYRHEEQHVQVASLSLDWQPRRLVSRHLHFDHIVAGDIDIALPASKAAPAARQPLTLPRLPLTVTAQRVDVSDVTIRRGETTTRVERLELSGRLDPDTYSIRELRLASDIADVGGSAEIELVAPHALEAQLAFSVPMDRAGEAGPVDGNLTLGGNVETLAFAVSTRGSIEAQLDGNATALLTAPALSGRLELDRLDAAVAGFDSHGLSAALDFQLLDDQSLVLNGRVIAPAYLPHPALISGSGRYLAKRIDIEKLRLGMESAPGTVAVNGSLRPDLSDLALSLTWSQLQWPLNGEPVFASATGTGRLTGSADSYRLALQADASVPPVPAASIELKAVGTRSDLVIDELVARFADAGSISGNGTVDWGQQPTATLSLNGDALALNRFVDAVEGRVNFDAGVTLRLADPGPSVRVSIRALDGELRGKKLRGTGTIHYTPDSVAVEHLSVRAGAARIEANGSIGEVLNLTWDLDVPDLGLLWPDAAGQLQSRGQARGTRARPALAGNLEAADLRLAKLAATRLSGTFRVGLDAGTSASIDFAASGATVGEFDLGEVSGRSEGTIAAHEISLKLDGKQVRLEAALSGGIADETWTGYLSSLSAERPEAGTWLLREPARLSVNRHRAAIDSACLAQRESALCVEADWVQAKAWNGRFQLQALPLAVVAPFLPPGLSYDGLLSGAGQAGSDGSTWRGQARVGLSSGRVYTTTDGEEDVLLGFESGSLDTEFDAAVANTVLQLDLRDAGRVEAQLAVPLSADAPLSGTVDARIENLSLVPALVPQVGRIDGRIEARLDVAGTRRMPDLSGRFLLDAPATLLPDLGITLSDTTVELVTRDDELQFEGRAGSGEGVLQLEGRLRWRDGQPTGDLRLSGERFRAIALPEIWLDASPQLTLSVAGRDIRVEGSVTVPAASITPIELDTGIRPTADQVIVGREPAGEPKEDWRIDGRVRVTAGDAVQISGFGLQGRLAGSVLIIDPPGQPTTARGSLEVLDGRYRAYGQELSIETGKLEFTGGPIDNPGLDLRAARDTGEVVAGVQVRGGLREPKLSLYSVPPMADTQAMSYLITGRGIEELDEAGQLAVNDAATRLALQGGSLLAASLGRGLGLDSVGLEDSGEVASTSLVVGKHLSPRLFVSYGIGLFEAINTVRLRYRINSRLTLETESGTRTSGDLLYSFER